MLTTIYEDSNLKISEKQGDSENIFLCFSGVGKAMGGIQIQQEEFNRATDGATAIFIVDKTRSWGNIDWNLLSEVISPYLVNKRVFSIGNSMGGFYAILASRHFLIKKVISFVPQYSIHKSIVPLETRWSMYTSKIRNWKYISLEGSFNDKTEYHVFYGKDQEDAVHKKLFPKQKNIIMHTYPGNHYIVKDLKDQGLLYGLIADIVNLDS
jgi:hypothetical protein